MMDRADFNPKISVVILNYNGMKFLEPCITSLLKSSYDDFEILVVDNGSKDDSVNFLRRRFPNEPKLRIIALGKNYGFAMGNNIGYIYTNPKSKFIFFLNNDTEVDKDCIKNIVKKMEEDEFIGAAQPKIRSLRNRNLIDAVGGIADYHGKTWHRGSNEYDYGQYDSITETFYAQGAAIVVRRSVIEKVGLFDPHYFMYYEETDLCWRIWLAGYKVAVIPEAIVYHYGGGSTTFKSSDYEKYFKFFHLRRNHLMTMLKNYSVPNILKYTLTFMIKMLFISILWSFSGEKVKAKAYLDALLWIFFHLNLIARKRVSIQKIRRIPDAVLMTKMIPSSII
jgi:GT2 family glycosyltransferase